MTIRVKTNRVHGLAWWASLALCVVWLLNFAAYMIVVNCEFPSGIFSDGFIQWAAERQAAHHWRNTFYFIAVGLCGIFVMLLITRTAATRFYLDYERARRRG